MGRSLVQLARANCDLDADQAHSLDIAERYLGIAHWFLRFRLCSSSVMAVVVNRGVHLELRRSSYIAPGWGGQTEKLTYQTINVIKNGFKYRLNCQDATFSSTSKTVNYQEIPMI